MKTRSIATLAASVATAALGGAANAQTYNFNWTVNGAPSASVSPGAVVTVVGTGSWTPANFGYGGSQFQVMLDGANASDSLNYAEAAGLGRNPLLRFSPLVLADAATGTGRRIGANAGAASQIDAAQAPMFINPFFSTANPIEVFRFQLTAGDAGRDISIGSPIQGVTIVTNANGIPAFPPYAPSAQGATIHVIPTPGAMALIGLGGVATLRRRRGN